MDSCSVTCGDGTELWTRHCDSPAPSSDSPAPSNGGLNCSGEDKNTTACNKSECSNGKMFYKF